VVGVVHAFGGHAVMEPLRPHGVAEDVGGHVVGVAHAGVVSQAFRLPLKPQFVGGHPAVVGTLQLTHEHAEPDEAMQPPQSHQITMKTTISTTIKPRT
jgi:hypothetical protein